MNETVRTFRAAVSSYVVLLTMFGGLLLFAVYCTFAVHPSFWKFAVPAAIVFVFVLLWLVAFRIEIMPDVLVLRTLFGTRRIPHEDILSVDLRFDLSQGGGPLRLFVRTIEGETSINAKVFSREAIRAVLDLGAQVATADAGGLEDGLVLRALRKRKRK